MARFGPLEATKAAELYRTVPRPRGREIDLAIAACAIVNRGTALEEMRDTARRPDPRITGAMEHET